MVLVSLLEFYFFNKLSPAPLKMLINLFVAANVVRVLQFNGLSLLMVDANLQEVLNQVH